MEWTVNTVNKWDDYSETLGVPDFQCSSEKIGPSQSCFKVLDDAAVHTCSVWMAQDTIEGERTFFTEIEPDELDHAKPVSIWWPFDGGFMARSQRSTLQLLTP